MPAALPLLQQWSILLLTLTITYITLVHLLRYQRLNFLKRHYNYRTRSSLQAMPVSTAFAIHDTLITLEFPFTFPTATTFALFKTYGIPSISSLLVKTNQLAGPPLVSSKRYADTGALLLEAVLQPPGSDRSVEAIARINYLHDRHRSKGAISDEDMLFTLSLFALEPMRWVRKYEWRELDQMEVCAVGTMWKYLGDALKVPYELLPGAYEERYIVPADSNNKLAEATLRIILCEVPAFFHGFTRNLFATVMEVRLRKAMLIPPPPPFYAYTFNFLHTIRKLLLRHLYLPRIIPSTRYPTPSQTDPNRIHLPQVPMHPWYIRPTFINRWGPRALLARFKGEVLPGDDKRFLPEGFLTRALGPVGLKGRGRVEQEVEVKRIRECADGGMGCPFVGGL
ncbi:MAG: hypothetical protein Q9166_001974 [cf. Caloplaca sp. 2 TL-2023]